MIPVNNNSFTVCHNRIHMKCLDRWIYYDYELMYFSAKIIGKTRHNNLIVAFNLESIAQGHIHKAIFCKRTGKCINRVGNKNTPEEFKRMYIKDFQLISSNNIHFNCR